MGSEGRSDTARQLRKILRRVVDVLIGRESGSSNNEYFGEERAVK